MTDNQKINILYVDPTQGSGGATKSLLDLLRYIDKSSYQPILMNHNAYGLRRPERSNSIHRS